MAAYDYERSWQFFLDRSYTPSTALDETRHEMWRLAAQITGNVDTLSGAWTVAGSSNSVAAGMDSVDRWHLAGPYTAGDFVRGTAGSAHSWMVLQSPSMNGCTFYMLISFDTSTDAQVTVLLSKAAFTGGSTTANPTSTDSWRVGESTLTWNAGSTNAHRFSLLQSTAGDFVWFVTRAGVGKAELAVSVIAPVGCDSKDAYPIWTYKRYGNSGAYAFDSQLMVQTSAASPTRVFNGVSGGVTFLAPQRTTNAFSGGNSDSLTSKYLDYPCWVVAHATTTLWHTRGRLPDILYMGIDNSALTPPWGQTIKNGSGTIRAVTMGALILPMNAAPDLS